MSDKLHDLEEAITTDVSRALAEDVRARHSGKHLFAFNYGAEGAFFDPNADNEATYIPVVGGAQLAVAGVSVWKRE